MGDRQLDERVFPCLFRGMLQLLHGVGCQVLGVQQVEVEILLDEWRPQLSQTGDPGTIGLRLPAHLIRGRGEARFRLRRGFVCP